MSKFKAIIFLFFLCACTTPQTVLVNNKTGQTQICGGAVSGSIFLGLAGYYFQSQDAAKCVEDMSNAGFHISKVVDQEKCQWYPNSGYCK